MRHLRRFDIIPNFLVQTRVTRVGRAAGLWSLIQQRVKGEEKLVVLELREVRTIYAVGHEPRS
jgi:hypothetical protein